MAWGSKDKDTQREDDSKESFAKQQEAIRKKISPIIHEAKWGKLERYANGE